MKLSVEQVARMSRLLDEALALDEAQRQRWLEALGPEQQDLQAALRGALLSPASQSLKLELLGVQALAAVQRSQRDVNPKAGERLGPYVLVRELGHGGMAQVWLAQRADGAFQREVALKLPMLSSLRQDLESRFERETQILANLEHPNIARLYDAGVTPEGLPYLAMEFVAGQPLTAWCDRQHLAIRERLKLFLQVLEAVQYAHGHRVIHRDLKPSNILVTEAGQVRLLDFGVAKLLEQEATELTQVYGRALTPEYASPELARGDAVEAASDIYALGVVLYELLSGSRPYQLGSSSSVKVLEQAIVTASLPPPSTQLGEDAGAVRSTTHGRLSRKLRGDLDAIVLKSLAKQPQDRYGSAKALSDELQRYLAGEPVQARAGALAYRLGKLVLRYRTAVTAVVTAALILSGIGYELIRRGALTWPPASPAQTAVAPGSSAAGPVALAASDKSIAVLPFVDMSEKKDLEYFGDGVAEEIRNLLVKVPQLNVIGRTSSFQFKGRNEDLRVIGEKLGVAYIVEGTVRKADSKIRVTAQLSDARSGIHRWAESYDSDVGDVLNLQEVIATNVARTLQLAVGADEMKPERRPKSPEVYALYLRGRSAYDRLGRSGFLEAERDYQEALRLDPSFVRAAEALALVYAEQTNDEFLPSSIGWQLAREAAELALSIDANSAPAHAVLASLHALYEFDWAGADAEISKALVSSPRDPAILDLASRIAAARGRRDDALRLVNASLSSDPLNPNTYETQCLWLYFSGDLVGAEYAVRRAIELSPQSIYTHYLLGQILLARGDQQGALAAMQAEVPDGGRDGGLAIVYHVLGRKSESDAALARHVRDNGNLWPYGVAQPYGFRGEADRTFDWLERAYAKRDPDIRFLRDDPLLARLRGDPRYRALLAKMKLNGKEADIRH